MRKNISRLRDGLFGMGLYGLGLSIALGMHLVMLFANYSGLVQAFEMLGADQKPMGDDPLTGGLFEAFSLGDITQSHLYAGVIVVTLAAGFWLLCIYLFKLIMIVGDRKVYQSQGDVESVREAERIIKFDVLPYMIITLIVLSLVAFWDIKLFSLRSLAGLQGLERPEQVYALKNLSKSIAEAPNNFALEAISCGVWGGYLSATFLTAFILKFVWGQLKEKAVVFERALLDLMKIDEGETLGETKVDASTITEESNVVGTVAGNAAVDTSRVAAVEEDGLQSEEARSVSISDEIAGARADITTGAAQETSVAQIAAEEWINVIGEDAPARLTEVMANPERYYKHEDGSWWNRNYYESLHSKDEINTMGAA